VKKKIISIGIGEFYVAKAPAVLITHNLGSCVGVALYDRWSRIGGLAHITLPSYKSFGDKRKNDARFADVAIFLMIERMKEMGAREGFIVAKIAGGADMFGLSPGVPDSFDIGRENVEAVRFCLQKQGINIAGEEVLGKVPRTMEFDLNTGKVALKTFGRKVKVL